MHVVHFHQPWDKHPICLHVMTNINITCGSDYSDSKREAKYNTMKFKFSDCTLLYYPLALIIKTPIKLRA